MNESNMSDGISRYHVSEPDTQDHEVSVTYPDPAPATPFTHLIPNQTIALVSKLELFSGAVLTEVPIAYRTWGVLNEDRTNCMVICHALTGSADVEDWWGPLMGPGLVFDSSRYFIFCANVLGSPYGTASPVSTNPATGLAYGPAFPSTCPRDDVRLQKIVLDQLGVRSIAVVIGGSMGGMACLEYPLVTPPGYVRHIVPIATCPRHSAWGISWGEAQRQSIYSDPKYQEGDYSQEDPPATGLAAARMAALLTYRSRDSFESRFGRRQTAPTPTVVASEDEVQAATLRAVAAHNDGHHLKRLPAPAPRPPSTIFSAQSYLRYQGEKFVSRFDANCYIHLTRKMDAHDVDYGREASGGLAGIPDGALVVAISSDGLFMLTEQQEMVEAMPQARLVVIESADGHDGFLLEFEQINQHVLTHLHQRLPEIYRAMPLCELKTEATNGTQETVGKKESVFGEIEDEITTW